MKEKYKVKEMWVKKDPISVDGYPIYNNAIIHHINPIEVVDLKEFNDGEIVDRHMSRYDTYTEALYDVSWNVLYFNSNYSFNRPEFRWNIGIWGWN